MLHQELKEKMFYIDKNPVNMLNGFSYYTSGIIIGRRFENGIVKRYDVAYMNPWGIRIIDHRIPETIKITSADEKEWYQLYNLIHSERIKGKTVNNMKEKLVFRDKEKMESRGLEYYPTGIVESKHENDGSGKDYVVAYIDPFGSVNREWRSVDDIQIYKSDYWDELNHVIENEKENYFMMNSKIEVKERSK